jgi:sterol desaturase/sphingolipid hydroxylase (fatty acid hydroxylase superfamily)
MPELRPVYAKHYDVFYFSLMFGITLSAGFGIFSALFRQNRYGFYGLCFAVVAAVLGCGLIKAPTLPNLPFYAGIDYFILTLVLLALIFIPLEGFFAKNPDQKILRVGWVTDMKYFMLSHIGIQLFTFLTVMPIQYWITHLPNNPIVPFVQAQPIWLQFIELLIVVDFVVYWLHRAMHEIDLLWRFHAIHHSTEYMDWLASSRLHIVEVLMTRFIATLPIFLLGFHTSAVFAYLVFISFHAIFIHSNVRFRFPYLRWLIATPEFHHWHHSSEKPAIDKNYAAFIPIYDVIFKSVYMPNHLASVYGTVGYKIPNSFVKQFTWPFKKYIKRLRQHFDHSSKS